MLMIHASFVVWTSMIQITADFSALSVSISFTLSVSAIMQLILLVKEKKTLKLTGHVKVVR